LWPDPRVEEELKFGDVYLSWSDRNFGSPNCVEVIFGVEHGLRGFAGNTVRLSATMTPLLLQLLRATSAR
jgi:hypothetical protein